MNRRVAFYTLGCKVNTYETEAMLELFKNHGYEIVDFDDEADVYIINTCTVTNTSDQKSRKTIRHAIKKNPNAIIAAVGCYARIKEEELKEMAGVDIVLGVRNKDKIYEEVEEYFKNQEKIYLASEKIDTFDTLKITEYEHNTRAFLKIQDGCNAFCSYCIIPYARGPIVSKPLDRVVEEAKELVHNGYKEIVLTGIHTGKYGMDTGMHLADVVRELLKIDGLYLLRLSSIEINEITDELLELMKSEKFARHLHIPIQSGSSQVLHDMNRRYDVPFFLNRIAEIREAIPGINITTDIIAGFPTETNEFHKETLETVKQLKFGHMHVFPYSKRNGTVAAKMKDLNGLIKDVRVGDLIEISDECEEAYNKAHVGKIVKVLVETNDGKSVGHTTNYLKVVINDCLEKNEIYNVRLLEAFKDHLIGEVVE